MLGQELLLVAPVTIPVAAAGLAMLGVAGKLLGDDARPGDLQTVLRGLPYNVTTEMDLALWDLAARIRRDAESAQVLSSRPAAELCREFRADTLPLTLQRGLSGFLSRYGHRAVAEIDVGMPRWSDDPAHILGVLANYLKLDDPAMAPDVLFERGAREAEDMVAALVERARRRGPLRARLVRFALDRARKLSGLRELPKYDLVMGLAAVRRELAPSARISPGAGRLRPRTTCSSST